MCRFSLLIAVASCVSEVSAQAVSDTPALLILRDQLRAIASEVVEKISLDPPSKILVIMEGEQLKTIGENAFLDALMKRGLPAGLAVPGEVHSSTLRITLLDHSVLYNGHSNGPFQRTIRLSLEARFERGAGETSTFLGMLSRENRDTVASKESGFAEGNSSNDSGFMEHVFTPLVVIATSVAIIYFLFTVRN